MTPETLAQIERQAREERAEAAARMFRAFGARLRARLGRAPAGRTA